MSTALMPARHAGEHSFLLRGDKLAFDGVAIGQSVNALVYGQRIAFLAIDGRAVSTTDDPDTDRTVQLMRWAGIVALLALGLHSFYRAMRGPFVT